MKNETLEAIAPCQECGEEVPETEVCGDGNDWFCPDCYGERRKLAEKITRVEVKAKKSHEQVLLIAQHGPGEALRYLKEKGAKWSSQKSLGLFRKCVAFSEQYPRPYSVEKFNGDYLGFFFTVMTENGPIWWMGRSCKERGGSNA
tara:strand:+ start:373 stop:807 length:435 start_codon:yes stop_codon:yes gene_type:complete